MVAFHFPPAAMGSGHLRTLGFARYLPPNGWQPIVLSANERAYPRTAATPESMIPSGCLVHRSFALDAGRQLAVFGKYPGFIAAPDRWMSWWPAAVLAGLKLIRRHRVEAIWSTYPVMSAHHIAYTLSRLSRLPWIADFRDPVAVSVGSGNRYAAASQERWEKRVLKHADRIVLTTPSAQRDYATRFPAIASSGRIALIPNGYDESAFTHLPSTAPLAGRPVVLVHSGLLYADGRDPKPFFSALAQLKQSGAIKPETLRIILRASGSETAYRQELTHLGIGDIVTLAPPISNREALEEQATADGLLLFQGARFNRQIPAKLYEYLHIGRPIFALTDAHGDTASLLRDVGSQWFAAMDDAAAIRTQLARFVDAIRRQVASPVPQARVARYARSEGARALAALFDEVTAARIRGGARAAQPPQAQATDGREA